ARPFDPIVVHVFDGRTENLERSVSSEDGGDHRGASDGRRETDSLEVRFGNPTQTLKANRELNPTPVCGKLMDFVNDDELDRTKMAPNDFPRENCLKGLGRRDK